MRLILLAMCVALATWTASRGQGTGERMPIAPAPSDIVQDAERALASGPKGSLAIRAIQGTKGGAEIGVAEFEVDLVHRNHVLRTIRGKLSEQGVAIVQDVPVGLAIRPLVRVKYAGATYQDVGPQMDPSHTSASVDVTVYEVTDQAPAWKVKQRTLAIAPIPGELDIVETIEVENPDQRTWMGAPADATGRRATVRFPLARGARDVQLEQGFHGWCCTAVQGDVLVVQMPLMPGVSPFRFTYRTDVSADSAEVRVANVAPCDALTLLIPMEGVNSQGIGLMSGEPRMIGGMRVRAYEGFGLKADASAGLVLTGLAGPPAPPVAGTSPTTTARAKRSWWEGASAPLVIAGGVGVAIVGGALLLYFRPPGGKPKRRNAPIG